MYYISFALIIAFYLIVLYVFVMDFFLARVPNIAPIGLIVLFILTCLIYNPGWTLIMQHSLLAASAFVIGLVLIAFLGGAFGAGFIKFFIVLSLWYGLTAEFSSFLMLLPFIGIAFLVVRFVIVKGFLIIMRVVNGGQLPKWVPESVALVSAKYTPFAASASVAAFLTINSTPLFKEMFAVIGY